jgi:calcineurin-like phosphoesterase family protein
MGNLSKYYITTDTHFGHQRIITDFGFRPANFEELIINNWKNTINENDTVFHLGDVTWGGKERLKEIMNLLPGNKILIRGNHDRNHSNNWFIDAGFSVVLEKAQVSGIILSHFPAILNEEEINRGIINVHGHFHNVPPNRWEPKLTERLTDNHYLLSLEDVNYTPISVEKALKRKNIKNSRKLLESDNEIYYKSKCS